MTAERHGRRSPLTVRLTVAFVLVAVAAVVALSVLTLWRTKHTVGRLADERQQATAESIAETLALAYRQGGGWQGVDIHPAVMIAVQADAAVAVHDTAGDELDLHNSMADTSKPAGMSASLYAMFLPATCSVMELSSTSTTAAVVDPILISSAACRSFRAFPTLVQNSST